MRSILLDTGAIVGLLRPSDRHHAAIRRFFDDFETYRLPNRKRFDLLLKRP